MWGAYFYFPGRVIPIWPSHKANIRDASWRMPMEGRASGIYLIRHKVTTNCRWSCSQEEKERDKQTQEPPHLWWNDITFCADTPDCVFTVYLSWKTSIKNIVHYSNKKLTIKPFMLRFAKRNTIGLPCSRPREQIFGTLNW